jgi:hypothetical protein
MLHRVRVTTVRPGRFPDVSKVSLIAFVQAALGPSSMVRPTGGMPTGRYRPQLQHAPFRNETWRARRRTFYTRAQANLRAPQLGKQYAESL